MQKSFGKVIDLFADWSVGNDDRQAEGADGGERSLGILTWIVRTMNYSVGKKGTNTYKHRGYPSIRKMTGVFGPGNPQKRKDG